MMLPALAMASIFTIVFFSGLAFARKARKMWAKIAIRIGTVLLTIALFGIVPAVMEASLMTTELAGRYFFFLMIGGALIYKLWLVKFIPLPSVQKQAKN
ncbi:hypothetical protein M0G74_12015 [Microbulbifer sp. CAU 1566]|uniref:hypothetical protein n=1 Tax=Microbulbifer sp. CAU 1566 TaxID=2933269 RepID=UPI002006600C|nr:hypothetical protein [Microbulbifer sp. CAU 1566]MCK7597999.1 hypothetical protein [Microbulbifer sp. CAU 1566]